MYKWSALEPSKPSQTGCFIRTQIPKSTFQTKTPLSLHGASPTSPNHGILLFIYPFVTFSLCRSGSPRICHISQCDSKSAEILLPQLLNIRDYKNVPPYFKWLQIRLFDVIIS